MTKIKDLCRLAYVAIAVTTLCIPATARAQAGGCQHLITTIPANIDSPGSYCLATDISTAIADGDAITINSSSVTIDLQGHTVDGSAAGPGTYAIGIHAFNQENITIRNGNVNGFYFGIWISSNGTVPSKNHRVESNYLDRNTITGIRVEGENATIRDNIVTNTGGSTYAASIAGPVGIYTQGGPALIRDNTVRDTFATSTFVVGIFGTPRSKLDRNVIEGLSAPAGSEAFGIFGSEMLCRDNTIIGATDGAATVGCTFIGSNFTRQ